MKMWFYVQRRIYLEMLPISRVKIPTNLYYCLQETYGLCYPNEHHHHMHPSARNRNMVIIKCSPAPTPASQLQENRNTTMMSADYWQVSAFSTLPKKTLQMNS